MKERYSPLESGELPLNERKILLQELGDNWRASEYSRDHFGIVPVNEQISIEADWLATSFRGLENTRKKYHFWQKELRDLKRREEVIVARLRYLDKTWVNEDIKMRTSLDAKWEDLNEILVKSMVGEVMTDNLRKPSFNTNYNSFKFPPYYEGMTAGGSKVWTFGNLAIFEPISFYKTTDEFGLEIKNKVCGKRVDKNLWHAYTDYCLVAFYKNWILSTGTVPYNRLLPKVPEEEKIWSGSLLPEAIVFAE